MGKFVITAHYFMDCQYSRDDLSYTPPEYFSRESNIMDALAIAEKRLASMEAKKAETQEIEKSKTNTVELPGQLTLWDILHAERELLTQYEQELKTAA